MNKVFRTYTLHNGIRLIHRHSDTGVAWMGLFIHSGSRDELHTEHGMAHFAEHMVFKGTKRRSLTQVLNCIEEVGGDLNAHTTKEYTCYHASFLKKYYSRAMDLLNDMVFHSTFPVSELRKEQSVVLDEINSYRDSPSELIIDDFESMVFRKHPLGHPILGTKGSVRKFERTGLNNFMGRTYNTDHMVISSYGDISFTALKKLAEKYFGREPELIGKPIITKKLSYQPEFKKVNRNTHQIHCMLGGPAYDMHHDNRLSLMLLSNMIGGPALNSQLNLLLREQHGLAYTVDCFYSPFTDAGAFYIYFGTDSKNFTKCLDLTRGFLKKISTGAITRQQINRAKEQIIGQMAIGNEHREAMMQTAGRSYLLVNDAFTYEEVAAAFDALKPSAIIKAAQEITNPENMSTLIYH